MTLEEIARKDWFVLKVQKVFNCTIKKVYSLSEEHLVNLDFLPSPIELFLKRTWHTSKKGNPYVLVKGVPVGLFRNSSGTYSYWIRKEMFKEEFATQKVAKKALYRELKRRKMIEPQTIDETSS